MAISCCELGFNAIALRLKQLDEEFIGEQTKLLSQEESEEWFEGELESWQKQD